MNTEPKSPAKILIVDDLEVNVRILENIIQAEGYEALCAISVREALEIISHTTPQLILSDYSMPEMNGLEFCDLLKKNSRTRDIPFVFITVADSGEMKKKAFEAGAVDYIPKPFERMEVVARVNNQLSNYFAKQEIENHNRMMHKVIMEQRRTMEKEQENLLLAIAKVVEMKRADGFSVERIGYNSRILAQSLLLSGRFEDTINDAFVEIISVAARLHEVGVLMLGPDADEAEYIECHTTEGAKLLREINVSSTTSRFMEMAVDIAGYHHARWDGKGYPEGVSGEEIPLAARITAVVLGFEEALQNHAGEERLIDLCAGEIRDGAGTVYDADIAEVLYKIRKQLRIDSGC